MSTAPPLNVPYVDTAAAQLQLRLGPTSAPALLARESVHTCGALVRLEVLGSSHRVTVQRDGSQLIETVACGLDAEPEALGRLPGSHAARVDGMEYRFTSQVKQLGERPDELRDSLAARGALVGVFPGNPYAFTALLLNDGPSLSWRTWHSYPQCGELVVTSTSVGPPPSVTT